MTTLRKAGYHHGDLRNALLDAAVALAGRGGPEAVTIRGAAKSVGVTPTAAYRHFANHDELLVAIKNRAMDALAGAMRTRLDRLDHEPDPVAAAVRHLATLGHGYVAFARDQPGLFATAFCRDDADLAGPGDTDRPEPDDGGGPASTEPFQLLDRAVDRLVQVGYLLPESRPLAEMAAWAAVHGVSMMLDKLDHGELPPGTLDAIVDRTLLMTVSGLGDGPAAATLDIAGAVARSVR